MSDAHGIFLETFVFRSPILGYDSFFLGRRGGNKVNSKVAFESRVLRFECSAFVMEFWSSWLHSSPCSLEVAVEEERVEIAIWCNIVAQFWKGSVWPTLRWEDQWFFGMSESLGTSAWIPAEGHCP
jgi:hypothetical protein